MSYFLRRGGKHCSEGGKSEYSATERGGGLSESKFPVEQKKSDLVNIKGASSRLGDHDGGKDKKCQDSDGDGQIGRRKAHQPNTQH